MGDRSAASGECGDVRNHDATRVDETRRRVLEGLLGGCVASLVPFAHAQSRPVDAAHGTFFALSAILVGNVSLDPALGARLHDALVADDPGFADAARSLLELIEARKLDPLQLQGVLDDEHSKLAALPRNIAAAWYLGIVGGGEHARCIAYENALNAVVVADVLKPPTYCYGAYGSWARKPG